MCRVWYCYHPWGKPCYGINFNLLLVLLKYKENNDEGQIQGVEKL